MASLNLGDNEIDAKALAANYQAALARLTDDWPDLSSLPDPAQIALTALKDNQLLELKALKYIWQRMDESG